MEPRALRMQGKYSADLDEMRSQVLPKLSLNSWV
jgi:hypothetical protein